jgi:hypothetical protein
MQRPPSSSKTLRVPLDEDDDVLDDAEREHQETVAPVTADAIAPAASGPQAESWRVAAETVARFRPVSRIMWVMIRAVYGRSGPPAKKIDSMTFSNVRPLIMSAATDRTLGKQQAPNEPLPSLDDAVQLITPDVAAAVCLIHAVCRRISKTMSERVWRPIIDDALLRAHMGYLTGKESRTFSAGRGMVAGFCGRAGLAILICSGKAEQAQEALGGLATGVDMGEICKKVYGCDPLQVAAMTVVNSGCSREIAVGIASFSQREAAVLSGSEQDRWLAAFSVVEHLRMNRKDAIDSDSWLVLGYSEPQKQELMRKIQNVQRKGHGWSWMTKPQLAAEENKQPQA